MYKHITIKSKSNRILPISNSFFERLSNKYFKGLDYVTLKGVDIQILRKYISLRHKKSLVLPPNTYIEAKISDGHATLYKVKRCFSHSFIEGHGIIEAIEARELFSNRITTLLMPMFEELTIFSQNRAHETELQDMCKHTCCGVMFFKLID